MANAITLSHVNFVYQNDIQKKHQALKDINLRIARGAFVAIVGKTGSGKSTLLQQLDALLRPTDGLVKINGVTIDSRLSNADLFNVHRNVGIVFQSPSNQLFGDTVKDNIEFGPRNFGFNEDKIDELTEWIVNRLGISPKILGRSPFDLSGGQMKKVTIAGALVYRPKILILDEPTVGLDYRSQIQIMHLIKNLNKILKVTVIMVTHQMDLVAKYASKVVVMKNGYASKAITPRRLFMDSNLLKQAGSTDPFSIQIYKDLKRLGISLPTMPLTIDKLAEELADLIKLSE